MKIILYDKPHSHYSKIDYIAISAKLEDISFELSENFDDLITKLKDFDKLIIYSFSSLAENTQEILQKLEIVGKENPDLAFESILDNFDISHMKYLYNTLESRHYIYNLVSFSEYQVESEKDRLRELKTHQKD